MESYGVFICTMIALIGIWMLNIGVFIYFRFYFSKDSVYKHWNWKWLMWIYEFCVLIINFKSFRIYYCKFGMFKMFEVPVSRFDLYLKPILSSAIYVVISVIPIFIADLIVFAYFEWGYQLLSCAIETITLTSITIILCLLEVVLNWNSLRPDQNMINMFDKLKQKSTKIKNEFDQDVYS